MPDEHDEDDDPRCKKCGKKTRTFEYLLGRLLCLVCFDAESFNPERH